MATDINICTGTGEPGVVSSDDDLTSARVVGELTIPMIPNPIEFKQSAKLELFVTYILLERTYFL